MIQIKKQIVIKLNQMCWTMLTHDFAYAKVLKSIFIIKILKFDHIIDIIFHDFKFLTISVGYFFPYLISPDLRKIPGIEPIHTVLVKSYDS